MVSYGFIVNKTETLFSDFLYKLNVYFWYFQSDTKKGDIFALKTSLDMKHFWVKSGQHTLLNLYLLVICLDLINIEIYPK